MAEVEQISQPKPRIKPSPKKTLKTKKEPRAKKYTPQQIDFALRYYLPNSPTYGNALRTALKAGYSESYAKTLTSEGQSTTWIEKIISEVLGRSEDKASLVAKAKKVLNKSLDSKDQRLAQDTAKFIAKTDSEFSEKQDITSGGQTIAPVALVEFIDGKQCKTGAKP